MLAALKGGDIDYIDEVPFTVADQLGKAGDIQLVTGQGSEVRDFGFNSNPKKKKNRELLDPEAARRRSRTRSTASRSSTSCSAATRPRAPRC